MDVKQQQKMQQRQSTELLQFINPNLLKSNDEEFYNNSQIRENPLLYKLDDSVIDLTYNLLNIEIKEFSNPRLMNLNKSSSEIKKFKMKSKLDPILCFMVKLIF